MQRFQTLQDPLAPIVPPYHRMPQLNFSAGYNDLGGFARHRAAGRVRALRAPDAGRGRAHHRSTRRCRAPFARARAGSSRRRSALRYADYNLDAQPRPGSRGRRSVTHPVVQRSTAAWSSSATGRAVRRRARTQTLEPRLFYVYVPVPQPGRDPALRHRARRLQLRAALHREPLRRRRPLRRRQPGDARAHLALAARRTGQEALRATLGQRYYFADERVGLTPTLAAAHRRPTPTSSPRSAGGSRAHWTFDATHAVQPAASSAPSASASAARYSPEIGEGDQRQLPLHPRRRPASQIDLSAQWPVTRRLVRRRALQLLASGRARCSRAWPASSTTPAAGCSAPWCSASQAAQQVTSTGVLLPARIQRRRPDRHRRRGASC